MHKNGRSLSAKMTDRTAPLQVFVFQGRGQARAAFPAAFQIAAAKLRKQHVQQKQLCDLRGNRAELQRAFIGAAGQDQIGHLRTGRLRKACYQQGFTPRSVAVRIVSIRSLVAPENEKNRITSFSCMFTVAMICM